MSIFENVVYPLRIDGENNKRVLDEVCERSLRGAALWDEVKDRLHENALGLSGGQQQRLCIARAIAAEPEVLLMDEPCSALDPIATGKIEDLIYELKGSYTILIVTHNMQQAARTSDFTAFMYLGQLIEYGPNAEDVRAPAAEGDRGLRHRPLRLSDARRWPAPGRVMSSLPHLAGEAGRPPRPTESKPMSVHMQKQLRHVELILDLSADAERAVHRSIQAVAFAGRRAGARGRSSTTASIDDKEVALEEEVLHILALEQPVAMDLRYLVAVLKMNNDLERIADLAVNIAEQAHLIAGKAPIDMSTYIDEMSRQVEAMLKQALDALLDVDVDKAQGLHQMDDRVDMHHRRVIEHVETAIRHEPERSSQYLHLLAISRNLERIADLATNIAEDVIYMARGEIQRHGSQRRD